MEDRRLQVGIDFSRRKADFCLLTPAGQVLEKHRSFTNSQVGYQQAKQFLQEMAHQHHFTGIDITGEATGNYWLPFFLQLAQDPDLAGMDLRQYVLNPAWVYWYKRSLAPDHKQDETDPFYIADRTRTRRPAYAWQPELKWLPLRFYTRLRYRLVQMLVQHKNLFHNYLFLAHSSYTSLKPFKDPFGVTSRQVLAQPEQFEELVNQPAPEGIQKLLEWSKGKLPDPEQTLQLLRQVAQESFPLAPQMAQAIQPILTLLLDNIAFLEAQIQQVEGWIQAESQRHPEVAILDSIPGLGLVFSSGIVAETGGVARFLAGSKWDRKKKQERPKNLRDAEDSLAKFAGLWWPIFSSGNFTAEESHLSKKGNPYLRYYLIEAADRMRLLIPAYQRFYARKHQEVTKHKHKRALVLTARKAVGLFVGLLHRMQPYCQEEQA